jgi:hypothetical protein
VPTGLVVWLTALFTDLETRSPHGIGLRAVRADDEVRWRCPDGDVDCAIGAYDEPLWPPLPGDPEAAPLLARRLQRLGVRGASAFGVTDGVVKARLHEGSDEAAFRAAAAPLAVEIRWIPPVGWARQDTPDGELLTVTNAAMMRAALRGRLRRSGSDGLLVGDTKIRLSMAHQLGPAGGPLLLDADGTPFAEEGDEVRCGGGFLPQSPVPGDRPIFSASSITRVAGA